MLEAVEGDAFGDPCFLEQVFVQPPDAVRIIELACYWGGEHDGVGGMFDVLLNQQVDGFLR